MDPASDERVQRLNEQIQQEQDPRKLAQLVEELMRVLDEFSSPRDGHRRQAS